MAAGSPARSASCIGTPTSSTSPGACARPTAGARLIVTDALFSMDGDVAPISGLLDVARRYGCRLMVDEAHAVGALGPGGRGAVAEAGLSGEVDLIVGTLGKALGSYGAYVCASLEIVDLLTNVARPFIFSTALPPPVIGAALAALTLLDDQPGVVEHLRRNGALLREALASRGLDLGTSRTQIVPVMVGDARVAVELCERALEGRVFAQAIRPPTVPDGTSRLRLSVMANHRADELSARGERDRRGRPPARDRLAEPAVRQLSRLARAA